MRSTFIRHWKKIVFGTAAVIVVLFFLARLYYNLTDDFRLANISYETPYRDEWAIEPPRDDQKVLIDALLAQEFSYIGKGAQSYAFGSADGKYVLKFFKFKHLRPSFWLDILPPIAGLQDYRETQYQRKKRKFEGVFFGYLLAYQLHRKESGLLFIHLNTTKSAFPTVVVKDKIGRKHLIPLDDVVFIIQERAETARTIIHDHLKSGDVESAKLKIDHIFELYFSEYQKGIFDNDHGVMRNVGFVGERPIHLDVGKFKKSDAIREVACYSKDLSLVGHRMARWLSQNEVEDFPILKAHIEKRISEISGTPFILQLLE